jgi:hypothetical protein
LCWLACVLPNGVWIDAQVGNPAVAHFDGECFSQGGDRAEIGTRCREESDHHQGADASGDQAHRQVSTLVRIPHPVAQAWEAYRQHPLLQATDLRSEGFHLLTTSASGVRGWPL